MRVLCTWPLALLLSMNAVHASPAETKNVVVGAQFRHIVLHLGRGVVLDVRELDGRLLSRRAGTPPVFDDIGSYTMAIDRATVSMTPETLANVMNNYVFAGNDAPISRSRVAMANDQLTLTGTLRKGVAIPFAATATVGLSSDGWIRIHPTSLKAATIVPKRLLDFFGLDLERVLKPSPAPGVRVEQDDLLLDPERILPPPQVRGRVARVWIEAGRLFLRFDSGRRPPDTKPPDPTAPNYMYYYGGTLRFGKLTMVETDLQLIDADPRDPFDFSPERYNEQLVAGYSRNTATHGLIVFMPDLRAVQAATSRGGLRPERQP